MFMLLIQVYSDQILINNYCVTFSWTEEFMLWGVGGMQSGIGGRGAAISCVGLQHCLVCSLGHKMGERQKYPEVPLLPQSNPLHISTVLLLTPWIITNSKSLHRDKPSVQGFLRCRYYPASLFCVCFGIFVFQWSSVGFRWQLGLFKKGASGYRSERKCECWSAWLLMVVFKNVFTSAFLLNSIPLLG